MNNNKIKMLRSFIDYKINCLILYYMSCSVLFICIFANKFRLHCSKNNELHNSILLLATKTGTRSNLFYSLFCEKNLIFYHIYGRVKVIVHMEI